MAVNIYIATEGNALKHCERFNAMGFNTACFEDVDTVQEVIENLVLCNVLIIDTFSGSSGRRDAELGYVMGKGEGMRVYLVGPPRHAFHDLLPAYKDWEDFFARMPFIGS